MAGELDVGQLLGTLALDKSAWNASLQQARADLAAFKAQAADTTVPLGGAGSAAAGAGSSSSSAATDAYAASNQKATASDAELSGANQTLAGSYERLDAATKSSLNDIATLAAVVISSTGSTTEAAGALDVYGYSRTQANAAISQALSVLAPTTAATEADTAANTLNAEALNQVNTARQGSVASGDEEAAVNAQLALSEQARVAALEQLAAMESSELPLEQARIASSAEQVAADDSLITAEGALGGIVSEQVALRNGYIAATESSTAALQENSTATEAATGTAAANNAVLDETQLAEAQAALQARALAVAEVDESGAADTASAAHARLGTSLAGIRAGETVSGLGLIAVAVGAVAIAADVTAAKWESDLQRVQANTTLTSAQTQQMAATVLQMAQTTSAPLDQLVQGYVHLTNEGFNAADATKILNAAQMLAVGTGADVSQAVNIIGVALHDYNANADQATQYTNVLLSAVKQGNTTMQEFDQPLQRLTPIASQLGVSFVDLTSAIAALTRAGEPASQVMSQMQNFLTHLADPTAAQTKEIEALSKATGVDLVQAWSLSNLQAGGFSDALNKTHDALEQSNADVTKLYPNLRGLVAGIALTGEGYDSYNQILATNTAALQQNDAVAQAYAAHMATQAGQFDELKNQAHELGISLGEIVAPTITAGLDKTNQAMSAWQSGMKATAATAALLADIMNGAAGASNHFGEALKVLVTTNNENYDAAVKLVAEIDQQTNHTNAQAGATQQLSAAEQSANQIAQEHLNFTERQATAGQNELSVTQAASAAWSEFTQQIDGVDAALDPLNVKLDATITKLEKLVPDMDAAGNNTNVLKGAFAAVGDALGSLNTAIDANAQREEAQNAADIAGVEGKTKLQQAEQGLANAYQNTTGLTGQAIDASIKVAQAQVEEAKADDQLATAQQAAAQKQDTAAQQSATVAQQAATAQAAANTSLMQSQQELQQAGDKLAQDQIAKGQAVTQATIANDQQTVQSSLQAAQQDYQAWSDAVAKRATDQQNFNAETDKLDADAVTQAKASYTTASDAYHAAIQQQTTDAQTFATAQKASSAAVLSTMDDIRAATKQTADEAHTDFGQLPAEISGMLQGASGAVENVYKQIIGLDQQLQGTLSADDRQTLEDKKSNLEGWLAEYQQAYAEAKTVATDWGTAEKDAAAAAKTAHEDAIGVINAEDAAEKKLADDAHSAAEQAASDAQSIADAQTKVGAALQQAAQDAAAAAAGQTGVSTFQYQLPTVDNTQAQAQYNDQLQAQQAALQSQLDAQNALLAPIQSQVDAETQVKNSLQEQIDSATALKDQAQQVLDAEQQQVQVLQEQSAELSAQVSYSQDLLAAQGDTSTTDAALLGLQVQRDQLTVAGESTTEVDAQIAKEQAKDQLLADQNTLQNVSLQQQIAQNKAAQDLIASGNSAHDQAQQQVDDQNQILLGLNGQMTAVNDVLTGLNDQEEPIKAQTSLIQAQLDNVNSLVAADKSNVDSINAATAAQTQSNAATQQGTTFMGGLASQTAAQGQTAASNAKQAQSDQKAVADAEKSLNDAEAKAQKDQDDAAIKIGQDQQDGIKSVAAAQDKLTSDTATDTDKMSGDYSQLSQDIQTYLSDPTTGAFAQVASSANTSFNQIKSGFNNAMSQLAQNALPQGQAIGAALSQGLVSGLSGGSSVPVGSAGAAGVTTTGGSSSGGGCDSSCAATYNLTLNLEMDGQTIANQVVQIVGCSLSLAGTGSAPGAP